MKIVPIPNLTDKDRARFLSKVAPPNEDGCRLWTAGMYDSGYGAFSVQRKMVRAHRVAYTIHVGPIPDGLLLDHHTCFNHACCTPEHLRPVTNKQNEENREGAQGNSFSGVRGVSPYTRKGKTRWEARAGHNGYLHYLGRFDTVEEAETAVIAARLRLFTHNDIDRRQNG